MTAQPTRMTDTELPGSLRRSRRWFWLAALFVAMTSAAVLGVAVAAQLTRPAPDLWAVYNEPNTNTREGRVPTYQEPNADTREGRAPAPAYPEPEANTRGDRLPTLPTGSAS